MNTPMNNNNAYKENNQHSFENPFSSFWMAGFECTDKLNVFGNRVDFVNVTGHLQLLDEDYKRLLPFNMRTIREGIRWSETEKRPYQYDWNVAEKMMQCAKANGISILWDMCHFGFPDDLTPLHPHFAKRFTAFCSAFVKFYRSKVPDGSLVVTPINEVNFLSWLGGEAKGTTPYCTKQGWEVKYNLMRAYIEAVAAMRETDPSIRILTTEPLVNQVPPLNATEQQIAEAKKNHEFQYQAMDILCGRLAPELGGRPEYLDISGLNYYYNNQWISGTAQFLFWANNPPDPRWRPLRSLLTEAYDRYKRPIALTETSHCGIDRPNWMRFVAEECAAVLQQNIPLWGICQYPVIDRPDWDHFGPGLVCGLWDVDWQNGLQRILHQPLANEFKESQALIENALQKEIAV